MPVARIGVRKLNSGVDDIVIAPHSFVPVARIGVRKLESGADDIVIAPHSFACSSYWRPKAGQWSG